MNNQILSQDEIDALLQGPDTNEEEVSFLTPQEIDALQEVYNIALGNAATSLGSLLKKKAEIKEAKIDIVAVEELKKKFVAPLIATEIEYQQGIKGYNMLLLQVPDAGAIASIMLGQEIVADKDELSDSELSAVEQSLTQVVASCSGAFGKILNREFEAKQVVKFLHMTESELPNFPAGEKIVQILFSFKIEAVLDSELTVFSSLTFAREFAGAILAQNNTQNQEEERESEANVNIQETQSVNNGKTILPPQPSVTVQPAQFAPIGPAVSVKETGNLGLILDVSLNLTVELGGAKMKIKDILELGSGSVIELDKLAGEPIDILINGKLIAKGEVVVIDENFGVKVTDIVSPLERVHSLQ